MATVDLCTISFREAPPGQVSNFENPSESLETPTYVVGGILVFLIVVCTAIRIKVNYGKLKFGDWSAIIGTILVIGYTAAAMLIARIGVHGWDVPVCWYHTEKQIKCLFVILLIYGPATFFSRAPILMTYHQLFSLSYQSMRIAVITGLVFAGLSCFVSIPIACLTLAPRPGEEWIEVFGAGRANIVARYSIYQGVASVVLDLYIFLLPIPILVRMKLSWVQRVQLFTLFGAALIAVAASIVSLVYRIEGLHPELGDTTWNYAWVFLTCIIDNSIALIVGSGPAIRTFMRSETIRKYTPRISVPTKLKAMLETKETQRMRVMMEQQQQDKPPTFGSLPSNPPNHIPHGGGSRAQNHRSHSVLDMTEMSTLTRVVSDEEKLCQPGPQSDGGRCDNNGDGGEVITRMGNSR